MTLRPSPTEALPRGGACRRCGLSRGGSGGATVVEYAVGLAFFVVVLIAAVSFAQRRATDRLGSEADRIGRADLAASPAVVGDAGSSAGGAAGTPPTFAGAGVTYGQAAFTARVAGGLRQAAFTYTIGGTTQVSAGRITGTFTYPSFTGPASCDVLSNASALTCTVSVTGVPPSTQVAFTPTGFTAANMTGAAPLPPVARAVTPT